MGILQRSLTGSDLELILIPGHILDEPDIPEQLLWVGAVGFYRWAPLRVENF